MLRKVIALLLACLVASPAWAGTSTLAYSPSGSSNLRFTTDSSSYYLNNITVWDYSAGANGWSIDSGHGGLVAGEGTAGSAAGGVLTVQGVASMTPFLVNPGTVATWGISAGGSLPANAMSICVYSGGSCAAPHIDTNGSLQVAGEGASGSGLAGNPVLIAGGNGTNAYTLKTDTSGDLTVIGTGTFAVQATLQASATTAIGKVDPNTIATWGLVAQGGASAPTNALLGGCTYNSGGQTLSSGNSGALQCDSNNYLKVNVETATGLAIGSTTSGQTGSLVMGAAVSAAPSLTTAQTDPLSLDLNGGLRLSPSCNGNTIPINQTGSTDVHTFTGYGYICSIMLISGTQQSVSLSEGTGTTCGTGTAYLLGGSGGTAVLAQYGGFSAVSGIPFMKLKNSADHLCVLQSSTGNVSGFITFADLTN